MLKTYTLTLRSEDGEFAPRFEPALCRSSGEALTRARELLARSPGFNLVEVRFGDQLLFCVGL